MIEWFSFILLLIFLCLSDKQNEDQPKSPSVVANVDPSLQEVPQQEVEKSVEGSTAIVWGILSCHSSLVVSDFLWSSAFVVLSSTLS